MSEDLKNTHAVVLSSTTSNMHQVKGELVETEGFGGKLERMTHQEANQQKSTKIFQNRPI